jgi:hypothetical protein
MDYSVYTKCTAKSSYCYTTYYVGYTILVLHFPSKGFLKRGYSKERMAHSTHFSKSQLADFVINWL